MSKFSIAKASVILVGLSMLATVYPAFAQNTPTSTATKPDFRQSATTGAAARNQIVQERIGILKENVSDKIEALREKIASKEAALKTKLQAFKDRKKADLAERVNINLNKINQNQTTAMKKHLDKISAILDRLEARVGSGKPDIKDPTAARTAITAARAAIASASAGVSAQSLNNYTIQVTSEGRIGLDAKIQRDKLHTDILAVRQLVIDAKQSVANAIRVAKSGPPPITRESEKEGTKSGQQ